MEEIKRNCTTCQLGFITLCDTLKNNEEYMGLKNEDEPFILLNNKFKKNFICDNYKCIYIEYPIEVSKINTDIKKGRYRSRDVGQFVEITPCKEEYKGKTFLGLYLGELPIGINISYNEESKELNTSFHPNPAIFVFDINKIIYGMESYWGIIEKEEDLKNITDADINNLWYVKALKSLMKE